MMSLYIMIVGIASLLIAAPTIRWITSQQVPIRISQQARNAFEDVQKQMEEITSDLHSYVRRV